MLISRASAYKVESYSPAPCYLVALCVDRPMEALHVRMLGVYGSQI